MIYEELYNKFDSHGISLNIDYLNLFVYCVFLPITSVAMLYYVWVICVKMTFT